MFVKVTDANGEPSCLTLGDNDMTLTFNLSCASGC